MAGFSDSDIVVESRRRMRRPLTSANGGLFCQEASDQCCDAHVGFGMVEIDSNRVSNTKVTEIRPREGDMGLLRNTCTSRHDLWWILMSLVFSI